MDNVINIKKLTLASQVAKTTGVAPSDDPEQLLFESGANLAIGKEAAQKFVNSALDDAKARGQGLTPIHPVPMSTLILALSVLTGEDTTADRIKAAGDFLKAVQNGTNADVNLDGKTDIADITQSYKQGTFGIPIHGNETASREINLKNIIPNFGMENIESLMDEEGEK